MLMLWLMPVPPATKSIAIDSARAFLRREFFAGGGEGQFAMFDASSGNERIGYFLNDRGLAAHGEHFQTIVMVQMDVK